MANKKGANDNNYRQLSEYCMDKIKANEFKIEYTEDDLIVSIEDYSGNTRYVGLQTGTVYLEGYKESKGGLNKSNKRCYIPFSLPTNNKALPAAYTLVMALGLVSDDYDTRSKSLQWHEAIAESSKCRVINHINGNSMDNRPCNLEITTVGLNNAHSALMYELEYAYNNEYVIRYGEDSNHLMYVDSKEISCKEIEKFNRYNSKNIIIRPLRTPKGEVTRHFSMSDLDYILKEIKGVA